MRNTDHRALWLVVAALLFSGCAARGTGEADENSPRGESAEEDAHPHGAGPHGGVVADWGGGRFHVEFVVDHDQKQATVYVLGDDAATPAPIRAESLLLSIHEPAFQVELAAAPREGEADDAASRFAGEHEELGQVREFAGTISGEVDGTPYAGDFSEHAGHDHAGE